MVHSVFLAFLAIFSSHYCHENFHKLIFFLFECLLPKKIIYESMEPTCNLYEMQRCQGHVITISTLWHLLLSSFLLVNFETFQPGKGHHQRRVFLGIAQKGGRVDKDMKVLSIFLKLAYYLRKSATKAYLFCACI